MLEWHRIIRDKVPRFIRMQDNISKNTLLRPEGDFTLLRYGKSRECVGKILRNLLLNTGFIHILFYFLKMFCLTTDACDTSSIRFHLWRTRVVSSFILKVVEQCIHYFLSSLYSPFVKASTANMSVPSNAMPVIQMFPREFFSMLRISPNSWGLKPSGIWV